jgi:hypothetical protein
MSCNAVDFLTVMPNGVAKSSVAAAELSQVHHLSLHDVSSTSGGNDMQHRAFGARRAIRAERNGRLPDQEAVDPTLFVLTTRCRPSQGVARVA